MAVMLKRSENGAHMPLECGYYRCCTTIYGKNTRKERRVVKRRDKRMWKRDNLD